MTLHHDILSILYIHGFHLLFVKGIYIDVPEGNCSIAFFFSFCMSWSSFHVRVQDDLNKLWSVLISLFWRGLCKITIISSSDVSQNSPVNPWRFFCYFSVAQLFLRLFSLPFHPLWHPQTLCFSSSYYYGFLFEF